MQLILNLGKSIVKAQRTPGCKLDLFVAIPKILRLDKYGARVRIL